MIFKDIFGPYLNWSYIDKGANVRVRVLERPAFILSLEEQEELRAALAAVVKKSIPKESLDYGIFSKSSDAFERCVITIVYDVKDNRPIAFNALSWIRCSLRGKEEDLLHLGLVVVDPDVREAGLSWILYGLTTVLLIVRKKFTPIWVSNVTQVPAIIGKVSLSADMAYPTPDNIGNPPFLHSWLVRQIMQDNRHVFGVGADAELDPVNFIIKNAYTGGSDHLKKFSEAQPHRNAAFNDFCEKYLDYDRGDDFIQIGQLNMKTSKEFIARTIPRNAVFGITLSLLLISVQSILSPILMWLDSRKRFGDLRPW
jgi:hypothetical protein